MPPAKSLTKRIKAQRTPFILERDYPKSSLHPSDPDYEEPVCCYCEQRFIEGHTLWHKTWEHLDNNKENEELWNLKWAHWKCNEDKIYSGELQSIAKDLIQENKKWEEQHDFELSSERESDKPTAAQPHFEADINTAHFQVTSEFLAEKIHEKNPLYELEDAIYSIVTRCRKKTGHGSHQSVRGYIKELCCTENKYEIEKKGGTKFIKRRTGQ